MQNKVEIEAIIQILALKKKQLVSVPNDLLNGLVNELRNFPGARIQVFGLPNGLTKKVMRKSAARHFKK